MEINMKKIKAAICILIVLVMSASSAAFSVSAEQVKLYGDANGDGKVSILDATLIQKHLAHLDYIADENCPLSDVNSDNKISVLDATTIQKYLVGLDKDSRTGKPYKAVTDDEAVLEEMRQEVFRLTNKARVDNGLSPLKYNKNLENGAQIRSKEAVNVFDHVRPTGDPWYTVLNECECSSYKVAGENIAAGYPTPETVVNGWLNSPGHRENIMSSEFEEFACGITVSDGRLYWVQLFMTQF